MEGKVIKNKIVEAWEMCKKLVMNCTKEQEIKFCLDNVEYKEVIEELDNEDKNYYTITEIAKELTVEKKYIIFWCYKFSDLLNIQSIGEYSVFTDTDLENLKKIKNLVIDKNMSTKDARKYLNKNKSTLITKRETDLIENNSLINEIYKMLTIQNGKLETLIESQSKILKSQEDIKEFINNKINEIIVNVNKLHEQTKEHDVELVNRLQILKNDDKIKKGNKSIDTTEDVIVEEISVTNTIYSNKPKEKQKININDILDDDEFWKDIW